METGSTSTHSALTTISSANVHRNLHDKPSEVVDTSHQKSFEPAVRLEAEEHPVFSDEAVKLSTGLQSRSVEKAELPIENDEQALIAIQQLSIAIQNSPVQAGAAQSNLTSNVVKNLLG